MQLPRLHQSHRPKDRSSAQPCLSLYRRKCPLRRRNRLLHISRSVCRAQERCLVLRRRQVHSTIQHRAKELSKRLCIRLRSRIPIRHWPRLKKPRKHRSNPVEAKRHTRIFRSRGNSVHQFSTQLLDLRINLLLVFPQMLQRRASRRHGQRISRQRSRLVHRTQRRHQIHNLVGSSIPTYRQSPANNLPHRRQVRPNVIELLRSAKRDPKSGHHFIEDQHRILPLGNEPKRYQIIVSRRNTSHVPHHRLHDHARDLVLEFLKRILHRLDVIEWQRQRELYEFLGNPRRSWDSQRRHPRPSLHQQSIRMPVITSLEFHNVFTLRISPCQSDR